MPLNRSSGEPVQNLLAAERDKLFPEMRSRKLADAANALSENRPELAQPILASWLKIHPADPVALNLMADIARREQAFDRAAQLLSRCVELDPHCFGYRFNYAVILRRLDRLDESLAQLDSLLSNDAGNPLFREQKADVLAKKGELAAALECRRSLTEDFPEFVDFWIEYGDLLRVSGNQQKAIEAYHAANLYGRTAVSSYIRLADLKTYRFSENETAQMQARIGSPDLSKDERTDLYFALGKAYGDQRCYAESFENYSKGNALQRMGVEFDPGRLTSHVRNCEALFTQEFFRERRDWGCESRAPIFIIGMPRSGSTLIEQILSSHSQVEGLEELAELDKVVGARLARFDGGQPHQYWIGGWFEFRSDLVRTFPDAIRQWESDDFRAIGVEYLASIAHRRKTSRAMFTDKALRNFGYVGLIQLILPNAKIIDAQRHPLDCGWSCFKSRFPGGQPFANRLADIGQHYANYARLMGHVENALPAKIHHVVYERLVENPELEVRRLLDYLELPFKQECLRFYENKRAVNTLSSAQVRVPLYKTGMAQWQAYEPWLGPLKRALGSVLEGYPDLPQD